MFPSVVPKCYPSLGGRTAGHLLGALLQQTDSDLQSCVFLLRSSAKSQSKGSDTKEIFRALSIIITHQKSCACETGKYGLSWGRRGSARRENK